MGQWMKARRRLMPAVALAGLLACLATGLAACGEDDEGAPGNAKLDLTIGDSVPLSGELSDFGAAGDKAAKIAVDDVIDPAIEDADADNEVDLLTEDNESDPKGAVEAARRMVDDGASCITGAWGPAETLSTFQSVSSEKGVLQITPATTSDELTGLDDPEHLLARTAPPASLQGPSLADYIEQELGGAEDVTVNVGARNDAYGTAIAGAFTTAWEEKGGTVGEEIIYDSEQPDYESEADKITTGKPDAFVIIDFPETYGKLAERLVETKKFDSTKTFATDALAASDLPQTAGEKATEGLRGIAPGAPDEGRLAKAFQELWKRSEIEPEVGRTTFDAQNFDAVILCYLSAVAAGSTNGVEMASELAEITAPPGEPFTWEQLPEAIKALQEGTDIDYEGASGQIDMDEGGDPTAGVYAVYRYSGGALDIFDEVPVAPKVGE